MSTEQLTRGFCEPDKEINMAEEHKTILIVEDEPDTATYLTTLLGDAGYNTIQAEDGDQALERVKANRPDLITLDISMPKKSGVRFYRDMKESDEWKGIPIVIVTGLSSDFEKFISTRRHVPAPDGYVSKPIDKELMLSMIQDQIGA
jgi:CheY-like chemotaxis protein